MGLIGFESMEKEELQWQQEEEVVEGRGVSGFLSCSLKT
jgi:hypothetical protein